MIEVRGVSKFYGSLKALDGINFHVDRGEVLGFLGPNGAGKTTAMKVLTTYISASEGTASIDGYDVNVYPREVRKRIGYLPETPPLYVDMEIEDYLLFAGRARGLRGRELKRRLATVVDDCGLRPKLRTRISELSKGFRQRTGIAQALIHDPPVLILDEPTSGLDPMQIIQIRKLIERLRENKVIIFSTHILQEATAVASRLVIIHNGRIIADGTVDELASRSTGSHTVRILVRGETDGLAEALQTIDPQVDRVETLRPPEGYARYELLTKGGVRDVRRVCEQITRMLRERNLEVAEVAPEKLTLEQIFLQLLRKEEQKPDLQEPDTPSESQTPVESGADDETKSKDRLDSAPSLALGAPNDDGNQSPGREAGVRNADDAGSESDATESPATTAEEQPADAEDPDATRAATKITRRPTDSETYDAHLPSETAIDAPEHPETEKTPSAAESFDAGGTTHFDGLQTRDEPASTDTEYSPRLARKEGSEEAEGAEGAEGAED